MATQGSSVNCRRRSVSWRASEIIILSLTLTERRVAKEDSENRSIIKSFIFGCFFPKCQTVVPVVTDRPPGLCVINNTCD